MRITMCHIKLCDVLIAHEIILYFCFDQMTLTCIQRKVKHLWI